MLPCLVSSLIWTCEGVVLVMFFDVLHLLTSPPFASQIQLIVVYNQFCCPVSITEVRWRQTLRLSYEKGLMSPTIRSH